MPATQMASEAPHVVIWACVKHCRWQPVPVSPTGVHALVVRPRHSSAVGQWPGPLVIAGSQSSPKSSRPLLHTAQSMSFCPVAPAARGQQASDALPEGVRSEKEHTAEQLPALPL
jgi:hypothetical protein